MKLFLKCFVIFIITLSLFLFNKKVYRLDALIDISQIPVSSYLQYLNSYTVIDNKGRVANQEKRVEFQYQFNEASKRLHLRYVSADIKALEVIASQLELSTKQEKGLEDINALNDWPKWSIKSIEITDQSPSYLSIALTLCTLISLIALILV